MTMTMQEGFVEAQQKAMKENHPEVDVVHLWYALLEKNDSLLARLYEHLGLGKSEIQQQIDQFIAAKPEVTGEGIQGGQYLSSDLQNLLRVAEKVKDKMKDEYISVEHIAVASMDLPNNELSKYLALKGITEKNLKNEIDRIRGGQHVTSQNPEATYEVLKKYGRDLVAEVKTGKLDPVIGRDQEIRNVIRILSRKTKNNPVLIGGTWCWENSDCRRTSAKNCKERCTRRAKG